VALAFCLPTTYSAASLRGSDAGADDRVGGVCAPRLWLLLSVEEGETGIVLSAVLADLRSCSSAAGMLSPISRTPWPVTRNNLLRHVARVWPGQASCCSGNLIPKSRRTLAVAPLYAADRVA